MAIRFLDDISSEGSSTFVDGVSAHDFFAYTGNLMNSLCAVSAVLEELVSGPERASWNNTVTVVSLSSGNWNSVYNYVNASSGIELKQQEATAFVLNASANTLTANNMVLVTPHLITDGGFF